MPVAEPFNAIGAGNGFPYCLNKIDVNSDFNGFAITDYVVWDLATAMKMYWNIHSITIVNNPSMTEVKNGDAYQQGEPDESDYTKVDPFWRVCEENSPSGYKLYFLEPDFTQNDGFFGVGISAFFDGDTSDDANFIGYGLSEPYQNYADDSLFGTTAVGEAFHYMRMATFVIEGDAEAGRTFSTETVGGVEFIKALVNNTTDPQVDITDIEFYTYA